MANTFTSVVRQHWALELQRNLEKHLVAMDLARMVDIPDGTTKNLPRLSFQSVGSYTKYSNITVGDLTTANDQIVINTTPLVAFQIDELDMQDNYIDMVPAALERAGYKLRENIDGDFLAQYSSATNFYDNRGLNPTSGTAAPIALTSGSSQNTSTVFGTCQAALIQAGAVPERLAIVASPFTCQTIAEVGFGNTYNVADAVYQTMKNRGYRGQFLGMDVYQATNLSDTAVLDLATNPTANDTVTIAGVTFTFVAAIGTTAGNVLIGADADASRVNLAALINTPETTTATGVALSADNIAKFKSGISAVDSPSGNTLTVTSKRGYINPDSVLTAAADDWQAEIEHALVMEKGSIFMALRREVSIVSRQPAPNLTTDYYVYSRYGLLTPQEGKDRMVDVRIQRKAAQA